MKAATQVTAKILYEDIAALNSGLYVWVDPDEVSILGLMQLLNTCPVKTKDSTELHCTVLHCKGELPQSIEVPIDRTLTGRLASIVHWIDHKGRNIVVGLIDSADLVKVHDDLVNQGLEHAHEEFNAHISFATKIEVMTPELLEWLDKVNAQLAKHEFLLVFDKALKGAPL